MKKPILSRITAVTLAAILLLGAVATLPLVSHAEESSNLAANATLEADSSQEDVSWSVRFLNDGKKVGDASGFALGYCSATRGEANVTADFGDAVAFNEIRIWPATSSYDNSYQGHMAEDFDLQVSNDGKSWVTVHETRGYTHPEDNSAADPYVIRIEEVTARYLRWHIITAAKSETIVAELEVFMNPNEAVKPTRTLTTDRPALELLPGMTDTLTPVFQNGSAQDPAGNFAWSSSDPGVVTVDADGNLKALAVGECDITVKDTVSGLSASCHVFVVKERKNVFTENIVISTFWPPIDPGFVKEEQYKLMADAGITYVMGAGENVGEKEDQLNMLSWCYKYGMQMMLGDDRMGPSMASKSYDELSRLLAEYKNVPGVAGYWLIDEPPSAVEYQEVYRNLKTLTPDKHVYINFLPDFNLAVVDDWLRYCAGVGYPAFYYQYDSYNTFLGETNYDRMLSSLNDGRKLCLTNGVDLAGFILSTGHGPYRQPDEDDVRWQMNVSLAFGVKNIQYFTWFHPTGWDGGTAIISNKGEKTPLYDGVSRVNHETLAIGTVLKDLEAYDVRVSGSNYTGLPFTGDFFAQPDRKSNFLVSLLRNDETGRNYMMVVSNDCNRNVSIELTLDPAVTSLELVSNGTEQVYTFKGSKLSMTAKPGEAFLFALPESCDFVPAAAEPEAGDNLVAHGYLVASESDAGGKHFIQNLSDGIRFSNSDRTGWKASENLPVDITVDLKAERTVNRIDLYPAGVGELYGRSMPKSFTLQVSDDGERWTDVLSVKDYKQEGSTAPSYRFDAQSCRYVRIHVTAANAGVVELCEVEVYHDDGSLPAPETYVPGQFEAGVNIAPEATVTASSSQESYGWALGNLTDGHKEYSNANGSNGFCNATKGESEVVFDFGFPVSLNLVKIFPALNPYDHAYETAYPSACSIDVSDDGETWTTVARVTDYKHTLGRDPLELSFETVTARFVRWHIEGAIQNEVLVSELEIFRIADASDETETEAQPDTEAPPETAPAPVTVPDTESDPEPDSHPETEETVDTIPEAPSDTVSSETEGPEEGSGCGSVLFGWGALPLLLMTGMGICRRRRAEDL